MRWNPNLLHVGHVVVEAALAALVWVLLRRWNAAQRLAAALEIELGLVKKRFEAATAGFHIRLLQVERQSKSTVAAATASVGSGRTFPPAASPSRHATEAPALNRGEWDLMMKVRQLTER